jgi:hypothetical protein
MFSVADEACRAAIVNEEAAQKLFGEYTAGETLRATENSLSVEVIGVVAMREPKPGTVNNGPVNNRPTLYYDFTGREETPPRRIPNVQFRTTMASEPAWAELETDVVSPGYFHAVGVELITGPGFTGPTKPAQCRAGIVRARIIMLIRGRTSCNIGR